MPFRQMLQHHLLQEFEFEFELVLCFKSMKLETLRKKEIERKYSELFYA